MVALVECQGSCVDLKDQHLQHSTDLELMADRSLSTAQDTNKPQIYSFSDDKKQDFLV